MDHQGQSESTRHDGAGSERNAIVGRRTFLLGTSAAIALAACGGDDEGDTAGADEADGTDSEGAADTADLEPGTYTLALRFPTTVLVPGEVRLAFSLFDQAAFVNDGPAELGARVVDLDGNPIGERMTATRYDVTPAAYYVWRPTIAEPGFYALEVDGGPPEGAAFQVVDAAEVTVPMPGDRLEGLATPTPEAPNGVDPICTRDPICPFHETTLDGALESDRGVVYLIGTPAFCQTGTCAPALEAMIEVSDDFGDDFEFVHAEVFTDLTAQDLTPAIEAAGLSYEPALFITGADGIIIERIDAIWGVQELRERLTVALA